MRLITHAACTTVANQIKSATVCLIVVSHVGGKDTKFDQSDLEAGPVQLPLGSCGHLHLGSSSLHGQTHHTCSD